MKQSLTDLLMLFYCIAKSNNNLTVGFYEFVDMVDNSEGAMDAFNQFLIDATKPIEDTPVKKKKANNSK